ncbi:MAG: 50S ribosomal protein L21 [Bacteroidales bacterium]|nr:50S ribosomal protein L21 [Bacteroidales bacterium]
MYAIVDIAGQQFKVEKDTKVFVHRLEGIEGSKVEFDKVLLIDNDKSVVVGTPVIKGAMVKAEIIDHMKGDKVIVFKKKRRKGYKVKNGHRQHMTHLMISEIIEKGAQKAETKAVKETKKVAPKATATKKTPAAKAPVEKKTAPKATTAKKAPAAKATAEKKTATKTAAKKPAAKKATTSTAKPAAKKAAPKTAAKKPAASKAKSAAKKADDKAK